MTDLDNHLAHTSKETRVFLVNNTNRFDFTFKPKQGFWLNIVESFISKAARRLLRGIRVGSRDELKQRITSYIDWIKEEPTGFRWR